MQKARFILLVWLFCVSAWAQELTLQGRVVDVETGEPLPFASIHVGEGGGTLTNSEGDFRLTASPQDVLTFSFVGFERLSLQACEVPSRIMLKPFERTLQELVVVPQDALGIVARVIKNLRRDFSGHKKDRQGYFMRTLLSDRKDSYLIESLMGWGAAVNLREGETFSGIFGMNAEGEKSSIMLRLTNIHHMAEIGPSAFMSSYWEQAVKPLYSPSMARKYYDVGLETRSGEMGEKLYRITFQLKNKVAKKLGNRRCLTGTAFVDAETLRLLRFEGEVGNAYQSVNLNRLPTAIRFHVNYDYSRGFASVGNIAVQGGNEEMSYKSLLFGIQADSLVAAGGGFLGDNLIDALNNAGRNSTLWEKYNIVARTKEEERIAFGE